MMTTYTDYMKARAEGEASGLPIPAAAALRMARWRETPVEWHGLEPTGGDPGDGRKVAQGVVNGFTIAVAVEPENDTWPGQWIGTFTDATDRYGERVARPDPSAIIWHNRGNWRLPRTDQWYTPTESLDELARYYAGRGASRAVAREYALSDIARRADQDAKAMEDGEYVVTVTASKAGVELGSGNLGGVGLAAADWERDLSEVLPDLIGQAIEEAQATLASLCE